MDISKAVILALNNIIKEGLTDIFLRPFEVDLLKNRYFYSEVKANVIKAIEGNSLESLAVNPTQNILIPKRAVFNYRCCALMHPIDTIKYLALALIVADKVERFRVVKSKRIVFSYRYKPAGNGYIFDRKCTFTEFRGENRRRAKLVRTKIIVKCDIANFYDRINLHRLESALLSHGVEQKVAGLINQLLLFWSNRNSYGLPVGSNASRILAEVCLMDIDDYLLSHGVKFTRFVDDYRFFCQNAKKAHYWLSLLTERLYQEGLTLNSGKTSIREVGDDGKTITTSNSPGDEAKPIDIKGYSGVIPLNFIKLSEGQKEKYREISEDEILKKWKHSDLILHKDIVAFCKIIVAKSKWDYLLRLPALADKFPQLFPFIVDLLVKISAEVPGEIATSLSMAFSKLFSVEEMLPEYILVSVVRLLGEPKYCNLDVLMSYFRGLKRNAGGYIGRATIDSISHTAGRKEVVELRSCYNRSDMWEKRAIIKLINNVLPEEERNAWLRNQKVHLKSDLFAQEVCFPSVKKKKNKMKKS